MSGPDSLEAEVVDGHSHMLVHLQCATNKRAQSVSF